MSQKNGCIVKITVTTGEDVSMSVPQYGLGRGKSHILNGAYYTDEKEDNEEATEEGKAKAVEEEEKAEEVKETEEEAEEESEEENEQEEDELSSLDSEEEEYWEHYWFDLTKINEEERKRPSTPPFIGKPWNIEVTEKKLPPPPPIPMEVTEATRKRIIEDYNIESYDRNNRMREELARTRKAEKEWIGLEWDAAAAAPQEKKSKI